MKPAITLKEYETIYRIVSTVGQEFAHGAGRSCQFYNVNGAYLLSELFQVDARPVMGAAFILVNQENKDVLSFARIQGGGCVSDEDAFHCWVETKSHIIDFTSPEYPEALLPMRDLNSVQRKMFQKPKATMAASLNSFDKDGDFYFEVNPSLTNKLLKNFMSNQGAGDLAEICLQWATRFKMDGLSSLQIANDLGEIVELQLKKSNLVGAW